MNLKQSLGVGNNYSHLRLKTIAVQSFKTFKYASLLTSGTV